MGEIHCGGNLPHREIAPADRLRVEAWEEPDVFFRLHSVLSGAARSILLADRTSSLLAHRLQHYTLHDATFALAQRQPEFSAATVVSAGQRKAILFLLVVIFGSLVLWPSLCSLFLTVFVAFGYIANAIFRAWLFWVGATDPVAVGSSAIDCEALPLYTVLIPLYREANILHQLASALRRIDYPRRLLDIKLVVEEDDIETVEAANEAASDGFFEVVIVPVGEPRTKPRACNYALQFARGEFLVIFDAEDQPEPDQLKKAVHAFHRLPSEVACLQARLNFFNARECWITRGMLAHVPQAI